MKKRTLLVGLTVVAVAGGLYAYSHAGSSKARVLGSVATPADRNAARKVGLQSLAAALESYERAHAGKLPYTVAVADTGICSTTGALCRSAKLADLSFLANLGYIQTLPTDPTGGPGQYATGYSIGRDASGNIRLSAPRAELKADINVLVK